MGLGNGLPELRGEQGWAEPSAVLAALPGRLCPLWWRSCPSAEGGGHSPCVSVRWLQLLGQHKLRVSLEQLNNLFSSFGEWGLTPRWAAQHYWEQLHQCCCD